MKGIMKDTERIWIVSSIIPMARMETKITGTYHPMVYRHAQNIRLLWVRCSIYRAFDSVLSKQQARARKKLCRLWRHIIPVLLVG
jgi:hypothetical protein